MLTAGAMRRVADILDHLEAADPDDVDNPEGLYISGPIPVRHIDGWQFGVIETDDGCWHFRLEVVDV